MTILEPDKGGNAAEVAQAVATPACWQCASIDLDWRDRKRGYCKTLADKLRAQGLPIFGNAAVATDGDPTKCGRDFVLTLKAFDELIAQGLAVPYAPDELWQEWMTRREQGV